MAKRKKKATVSSPNLPYGMQQTREVSANNIRREKDPQTFTPMQVGQVDTDPVADIDNPAGVQGLRGPLNQEGQGNRQDDETAELEEIEPTLGIEPNRNA